MPRSLLSLLIAGSLPLLAIADPGTPAEISFNRDIRPILSENCFACHGPDKKAREADRRLDTREGAIAENEGVRAIVPGDPGKSELLARITSHDRDEVMPPPKTERRISEKQVATLKRWIEQGAPWESHWSLIPPKRPALPAVANTGWARNDIDRFVLARLEQEKLTPSKEADPTTLIRRVTFDLTGLPPTPAEVDAFLADRAPDAYERLVDRLLASPRYGEKMALHWLDLSRYADTHGYHLDSGREMWRWREWVIESFNRNLPYDKFVLWQLAGDLLPNATIEQKLATGFCRNNMINFEGGADAQEYLTQYVFDRVNTFGTAFLGLTVGCAQCHDHKFDPITQKEYYQLYAYFNAVPEKGLDGSKGNATPVLSLPTPEQEKKQVELNAAVDRARLQLAAAEKLADEMQAAWEGSLGAEIAIGPKRLGALPAPVAQAIEVPQAERTDAQRTVLRDHHRAKVSKDVRDAKAALDARIAESDALKKQVVNVMVMEQMDKPRDSFVLQRGLFNSPGEKVEPGVPASLPALPADAPKNRLALATWVTDPQHPLMSRVAVNRFWKLVMGNGIVKTANDFGSQAEWPSHPELLDWLATEFTGTGWDLKRLMRTMVTSATYRQTASVSRELLEKDPLNRLYSRGPRFRLSGEEIRDTALAISGLLDPRIGGPSVSPYQPPGLWEELSSRKDSSNWTAQSFVQSHGADLYRRSMYTFWKRTSPPPQLTTFDAPDRETCTVSRERTNTPLQALVLMNDPTYVEASRILAEKVVVLGGTTPVERIRYAFRLATARVPSAKEETMLLQLLEKQQERYKSQPEEAVKLLSNGEFKRNELLNPAEVAAWTNVASTILNLDETVTRG
jgi:hypothetical protein